jgi:hypothetical protein
MSNRIAIRRPAREVKTDLVRRIIAAQQYVNALRSSL